MFFFRKKNRKEAQIDELKKTTLNKIDEASEGVRKINKVLDRDDVTLQIYYATRKKKGDKHG